MHPSEWIHVLKDGWMDDKTETKNKKRNFC